jgi:anti-anti-sigma factor
MQAKHNRVSGDSGERPIAQVPEPGRRAVDREPERRDARALAVRSERRADVVILWLSGALDRATSALLDRELDAQAGRTMRLVLDLTGLEFIDSSGLDTLERTHRRASERAQRLSFRQGLHVGRRPLDLIRNAQPRARPASRRASGTKQGDYFPLAMASADVDHQRPRDRPWGALDARPGQAAGAGDAPSLPGVARAAPWLP